MQCALTRKCKKLIWVARKRINLQATSTSRSLSCSRSITFTRFMAKAMCCMVVSFDVNPEKSCPYLDATVRVVRLRLSPSWALWNAKVLSNGMDNRFWTKRPYQIAHLGIGYVPENRDIFPKLTVHQNLMLGQKGKGRMDVGVLTICTRCFRV
jgi:hypothetical protein